MNWNQTLFPSQETAPISSLFSGAVSYSLLSWPQDSWGYSLAKEGAKREPDRAKHKKISRHQLRCSEGTFYGAAGVVGSTTACFLTNTTPSARNEVAARFFY